MIQVFDSDALAKHERFDFSDLASRIKYFMVPYCSRAEHFISYMKNGKIVGIANLELSPYEEKNLWIKYISVDPDYRNRGIGTILLAECFKYAAMHNKNLEPSEFQKMGKLYLKPKFDHLSKQYNVNVLYTYQ